jgi:hypothetical protein
MLGVTGVGILAWLSVTTGNFLVIIDYRYDKVTQQFELSRNVDWPGDVTAVWETSVSGNGLQCSEDGRSPYERFVTDQSGQPVLKDGQPVPLAVVRFPAGANLLPCLSDPQASLVTKWSMHVWGPIYLRPTMRYIPARD